jgi:glycosyltransferase involved in cell wall biosynthesis
MAASAGLQSTHVGLNLVYLVPGETGGMEVYARELVKAMRELPECPRLTAFVGREATGLDWLDGVDQVVVPVRASSRIQWVRGEQQHLPRLARRAGVDVLHSLANTAPVRGPFRRVTTVHDLIHLVHPEAHFGLLGQGLRVLVSLAVRRSNRVIAVSQSTRQDLIDRLRTPPEKIDVVPNGVLPPPSAPPPPEAEIRERFGLAPGRDVLLAASAKRPHKNLVRLLEAVARMERRPLLVLPGYATEHEQELRDRAAALGISDDVRFLGWLGPDDLEGLYAVSSAFVMPSLYEGFGLPVLEAMARGVPTATSNRSSLPEVAGDAALLFDPEDVGAITAALESLLYDPATAERLRAAGPQRAREFSWDRAARQTLDVYRRTLESAP